MGGFVLAGFAALSVVGLALIGAGAMRRARLPLVLGAASSWRSPVRGSSARRAWRLGRYLSSS